MEEMENKSTNKYKISTTMKPDVVPTVFIVLKETISKIAMSS